MAHGLKCRAGCGACCISPSISSAIPKMPNGKPAGIPCAQLDENFNCQLFSLQARPSVCLNLKPCYEMCGNHRDEAISYLTHLEKLTANDN